MAWARRDKCPRAGVIDFINSRQVKILGSLSKDVSERRPSNESTYFALFGDGSPTFLGKSFLTRQLSFLNLVAPRYIKKENASFPVDVCH